jgi:hypothetical protein
MDTALSIALGLGLAAACGFRIFVPLLVASGAAMAGQLELSQGFEWLGTAPALVAFASATALEVGAYYIPWFDHLLDTLATPAAVAAGVLASASVVSDMSPLLKWTVALIGGGGVAGLVQGATVMLRLKSGALTGGLANPVIATAELLGATAVAVLALVLPLICLFVIVLLCVFAFRAARRVVFGRTGAEASAR